MQNLLRLMLAGLAVGLLPAGAGAATLTYVPVGAPLCLSTSAPAACNEGGASVSSHAFSFDVPGAVAADEILTGAVLSLNLFDDFGRADGNEKLRLYLDGTEVPVSGDVQHDLILTLGDLSLLADDLLWVSLSPDSGDFFFGGATLTLLLEDRPEPASDVPSAAPPASAVPLPGSLVLLGLGATALAARIRRG